MLLRTKEAFESEDFYTSTVCDAYMIIAIEDNMSVVPTKLHELHRHIETSGYRAVGPALLTPVQKHLFPEPNQSVVFVIGIPII